MYKVLLADDEGIALDALKFILNKDFHDCCTIRTAQTGRGVIEIADTFRPDIAVMDIQMPGINGMEAIKEIHNFSPSTIFIIVSAYDRFTYAKEAIRLGVMEYLTKPLDREQFADAMRNAMRSIDKEKERRNSSLRNREKLESVVPIIESGFVYSLILSDSTDGLADYSSLLEITAKYGCIMVIEFGEISNSSSDNTNSHLQNRIGTGIRIRDSFPRIREAVKEFDSSSITGSVMSDKIIVFLPFDHETQEYNDRIRMIERVRVLISNLESKTDAKYRVGIGSVQPFQDMRISYREAVESLKEGTDTVAHADDLPVACEYEKDYPIDLEKKLFSAVEAGDVNASSDYADRFFSWMTDTHRDMIQSIRLKSLEFVLWAEHVAYSNGAKGQYRFGDRQDYMDICYSSDIDTLRKWFDDHITDASRCVITKNTTQADNLIDQARKYISAEYMNDISLDDISRRINISSYYFSKLFKEETGVNFIEYLTDLRMEKSKELLASPNMSIKDICVSVGYQDPNYFSRIFKKINGVTPSEYREQITVTT